MNMPNESALGVRPAFSGDDHPGEPTGLHPPAPRPKPTWLVTALAMADAIRNEVESEIHSRHEES
jgi:hypothetical protein